MIPVGDDRCREVLNGLLGRRSGVIRQLWFAETIDGDAPLHHAVVAIANPHPDLGANSESNASGSGLTRHDALMAAVGEGLERYLAASYSRNIAPLNSCARLDYDTLSPSSFCCFDSRQTVSPDFPFHPVSNHTPLRWLKGTRLSDGSVCGVPAFAVYLPYRMEPGEPLVAPGLSTGLACGESREAAVFSAVCEVVERDAFALTWLSGASPPTIEDARLRENANDVLPPFDQVTAYDITSDVGIPVILVVCCGKGPRGLLWSIGAACSPDAKKAIRKAALEASQDRVYVRQLIENEPEWRPADDFSNVTDFSRHARLYSVCPELARDAFRFLSWSNELSQLPLFTGDSPCDVTEQCQYVIDQLVNAGHDGAIVDLTPSWAADLQLHVVKAVIPSLMPLHGHHGLAYLDHARLLNRELSLPRHRINHEIPLWPYPHPFP
jgi:ribosomal protein S12 methylthiotransferase accessory factor